MTVVVHRRMDVWSRSGVMISRVMLAEQKIRHADPAVELLALMQHIVLPLEHLGDRVLGLIRAQSAAHLERAKCEL
jgi:hypothetical protein